MINKSFSINTLTSIKNFNKSIFVDSDKSMSIRSFLIGSISHGISKIENVLESDDVICSIKALEKLI